MKYRDPNGLSTHFGSDVVAGARDANANAVKVSGAATTVAPTVEAVGDDTNIGITLKGKGTGTAAISTGATGTAAVDGGTTNIGGITATAVNIGRAGCRVNVVGTDVVRNAAAGAAGAMTEAFSSHAVADNTAVNFFTVSVPNAIHGASVELFISSMLGDGDSTDSCLYTIGISRITGAATKAVVSTKSVVGATAGAAANAVITAAVSANTGANGATQTFTITIKNARSAGSADNHQTTAFARLINLKASGITIAAA